MSKSFLTIASLAVAALIFYGIATQNGHEQADNILAELEQTAEDTKVSVTKTTVKMTEEAQEMANHAEAEADEAYQAMVDDVVNVEPAAGDEAASKDDSDADINIIIEDIEEQYQELKQH